MKRKLQIVKRQAKTPLALKPRKPHNLRRFIVGLALSSAFASAATMVALRWRRHEEEALALEHRSAAKLLDKIMPLFEFQDSIWVHVDATPRQIFRAFDDVTLSDMPLAWVLGALRYLPAYMTGKAEIKPPGDEPFGKQLLSMGNTVLAQDTDREIVIGMIGKFHQLTDQAFVPFKNAEEFADFNHVAYQKLAMSIRVEPDEPIGGYTLVLEHRTHALSDESEQQFARYWLLIKPGGALVTKMLLNAVKRRAERYAAEDMLKAVTQTSTLAAAAG